MDDAFAVSKLVKFSTKKQQTGEVDGRICSGITRLQYVVPYLLDSSCGFPDVIPSQLCCFRATVGDCQGFNYRSKFQGQNHWCSISVQDIFFFLGVNLAELVLKHTDNLSTCLQTTSTSVSDGGQIASMKVTTVESLTDG